MHIKKKNIPFFSFTLAYLSFSQNKKWTKYQSLAKLLHSIKTLWVTVEILARVEVKLVAFLTLTHNEISVKPYQLCYYTRGRCVMYIKMRNTQLTDKDAEPLFNASSIRNRHHYQLDYFGAFMLRRLLKGQVFLFNFPFWQQCEGQKVLQFDLFACSHTAGSLICFWKEKCKECSWRAVFIC